MLKNSQYKPYIVGDIYNNHLIVNLDNVLESIDVYVDLSLKSIVDYSATLTNDVTPQAEIVYEGDDFFVVSTGIEYIEVTQYGGGNAYSFEEGVPQFQASPKAEYWLRSTNYLEFTDLIYSVE